jgi:hypothetical protein
MPSASGGYPGGKPGMGAGIPGMGGPGGPGSSQPGATPIGPPSTKKRTEFVLCFVWREPTPTDPTPVADPTLAPATGTPTGY